MNREIKFRAYDPAREQMYMDCLIGNKGKLVALEYEYECGDINTSYATDTNGDYPESFEVMQFTGLKDKNGIEIYEGDILEIDDLENTKGIVVFDDGGFKLREDNVYFSHLSVWRTHVMVSIIGNIYENADILTNEA